MKSLTLCLIFATVMVLAAAQALAGERIGKCSNTARATAAASVSQTSGNQDWRCQYFEGRWWYWMPDNHWVYYDNGRWIDLASGGSSEQVAGPIRYEARYGTDSESPTEGVAAPTVEYAPRGGYYGPNSPVMSFGTHGNAISFGF
jgi:hypothetical protein